MLVAAPKTRGVTLVETLAVTAIVAILAMVAAPSFKGAIERARLKAASEEFTSALYLAKSEALKANQRVFFSIQSGANQCYGFKVGEDCDCTENDPSVANTCSLLRASLDTKKGVTLTSSFPTAGAGSFEPVRGTASSAGQVTLATASGYTLKTGVTSVGRVYVCTVAGTGAVPGYTNNGC